MAEKITIHRVSIRRGYYIHEVGTTYSLRPWAGNDADYEGDSEPLDVILPDGYTVGDDGYGIPTILNAQGQECPLVAHSSGRPQIADGYNMPVLQLAVEV